MKPLPDGIFERISRHAVLALSDHKARTCYGVTRKQLQAYFGDPPDYPLIIDVRGDPKACNLPSFTGVPVVLFTALARVVQQLAPGPCRIVPDPKGPYQLSAIGDVLPRTPGDFRASLKPGHQWVVVSGAVDGISFDFTQRQYRIETPTYRAPGDTPKRGPYTRKNP